MIEKYNIFKSSIKYNDEIIKTLFEDYKNSKPIMKMLNSFYSRDSMSYRSTNVIKAYQTGTVEKITGMNLPTLNDEGKKIKNHGRTILTMKCALILKYLNKLSSYEKRLQIKGEYYNSIKGVLEYELENEIFINKNDIGFYLSDHMFNKIKTMLKFCIEEQFFYDKESSNIEKDTNDYMNSIELKIVPLFRKVRLKDLLCGEELNK